MTNQELEQATLQLQSLFPNIEIIELPSSDSNPYENMKSSLGIQGKRAYAIAKIYKKNPCILVTSPKGLIQRIPSNDSLIQPLVISKEALPRELLLDFLKQSGYEKTDLVKRQGDYALRGALIDVFPPTSTYPLRIDYFGENIDSLRLFDTDSQKTIETIESTIISPIFESKSSNASLKLTEIVSWPVYFDDRVEPLKVLIEMERLYKKYSEYKFVEEPSKYIWTFEEIQNLQKQELSQITDKSPDNVYFDKRVGWDLTVKLENRKKFEEYWGQEERAIIIASSTKGIQRMVLEIFKDMHIEETKIFPKTIEPKKLYAVLFPIAKGFETKEFVLLNEKDVLGPYFFKPKRTISLSDQNFSSGDRVVHRHHGLGEFQGLECLSVNKILHECVKLLYADNNRLYVPVENFDLITRYTGNDQRELDTLGSLGFQKRKAKVKERINALALHLMEIAAERSLIQVDPIIYDHVALEEFACGFPYVLTEDQSTAIDDIFKDLASGSLMDRIVCGDPGFGKTEIALRAAFAVINSGKQVAFLTPTTTLTRQHYSKFVDRFKGVAQLSRATRNPQEVISNLANGRCKLVVGTHALLSDKIKFKNLGLLIIDEEHHFGVNQKEKIKERYRDIHILSLSATPIPRTLQLSLSGIKSINLLSSPPRNRTPIKTYAGPFDDIKIQEAIEFELNRGGQVFLVAPRIQQLDDLAVFFKKNFPKTSYGILHGQMPTADIEDAITNFERGNFEVLICTQIIEAGVDLPRANTIIIKNAHLLGLSQLYQLRGRVGRSHVQAFAYLTYDPTIKLTDDSEKRLEFMQRLDKLGVGFNVASFDMDTRGYGNVVGQEQSGHIEDVGIELYQQLLEEAMQQCKKGIAPLVKKEWTPQINLKIPVLIPESYIPDASLRMEIYKNLSKSENIDNYQMEIKDRFGTLPEEVNNLFQVVILKNLCQNALIEKIDQGPKGIGIYFHCWPSDGKMKKLLDSNWGKQHVKIIAGNGLLLKIPPVEAIETLKKMCKYFERAEAKKDALMSAS